MIKYIQLQSFHSNKTYQIELHNETELKIQSETLKLEVNLLIKDNTIEIKYADYISDEVTLIIIEAIFSLLPKNNFNISFAQDLLKERDDIKSFSDGSIINISRNTFSTLGNIWAKRNSSSNEVLIESNNVKHPKRVSYREGELLYRKFFPMINKTISFRVAELSRDLDSFHRWHNKDFISNFWELNKSKEELENYLRNALTDAHSIPTILEFNNEPIGYFEFYWVKEDRLGPFYNFGDYDRGFHFLVGEETYLGRLNIDSILKATSHYVFLNDVRTSLLAGEPRSDNTRIIRYIDHFKCWRKEKEFDFPHKRAALLLCEREIYFEEGYPWI